MELVVTAASVKAAVATYSSACAAVKEHNKASVSWLQRQLGVGYNTAAGFIERMEKDGFVSAPDHVGRRTVLLNGDVPPPAPAQQMEMIPDLPEARRGPDDRLRLLIERVERLEEEEKGLKDDKRDVYGEAKAHGYDVKIMREMVRIRKLKPDARRELEVLLDTYKAALGID